MSSFEIWADSFRRAFALAYFLHPEKSVALRIAAGALSKLEVAASAQAKRLYYHAQVGRRGAFSKRVEFRTKVSLTELTLLQRLVYIESEPHERRLESESRASLSDEDMAIRFVKHLVQITVKRNSFYVTLGVTRLLHNYSTSEAMQIYDSILDDSRRVKDDDYFRSRKAILMADLKARFGEALRSTHGPRGEERFDSHAAPHPLASAVAESLERFTPWGSACVSSTAFQAGPAAITGRPRLTGAARDENRIEVNRMHAILHPGCFARLIGGLRLDAPQTRLEVPRFLLARDSDRSGSGSDRRRPSGVSEEELAVVASQLAQEAARRKAFSTGLLRILVDGVEQGRIDPGINGSVRIDVAPGAELIEVRGRDSQGDLLLATHVLSGESLGGRAEQTAIAAVTLESGQTLRFRCGPETDSTGARIRLHIDVTYKRASPLHALSLGIRRLLAPSVAPRRLAIQPVIAFSLFLLTAGLFFYLQLRQNNSPFPPPRETQRSVPRSQPATAPRSAAAIPSATRIPDQTLAQNLDRGTGQARRREGSRSENVETRSLSSQMPTLSLHDVRRVLIECPDEPLRARLVRELRSSGQLIVVETPEMADAAVRVSRGKSPLGPDERNGITIRLIGPNGKTLWPTSRAGKAGQYSGSEDEVARESVRDLLTAIGPRPPTTNR